MTVRSRVASGEACETKAGTTSVAATAMASPTGSSTHQRRSSAVTTGEQQQADRDERRRRLEHDDGVCRRVEPAQRPHREQPEEHDEDRDVDEAATSRPGAQLHLRPAARPG